LLSFFVFVAAKKAMAALLPSPSCVLVSLQHHLLFLFCCSKEGDSSRAAIVFFFCFCCSEEGDDNFCFSFVTTKKVTVVKLSSPSSVFVLIQ